MTQVICLANVFDGPLYLPPLPQQGLELLTTLFYKEHNAIADNLAKAYPTMTDQQLYDKARMITAAAMAKIHTTEWTPAILPNKAFTCGMWANWKGPISLLSPQDAEKVEKILPRPHEGIHGYGGSPRNDAGVKFSMTEVRPQHSTAWAP